MGERRKIFEKYFFSHYTLAGSCEAVCEIHFERQIIISLALGEFPLPRNISVSEISIRRNRPCTLWGGLQSCHLRQFSNSRPSQFTIHGALEQYLSLPGNLGIPKPILASSLSFSFGLRLVMTTGGTAQLSKHQGRERWSNALASKRWPWSTIWTIILLHRIHFSPVDRY